MTFVTIRHFSIGMFKEFSHVINLLIVASPYFEYILPLRDEHISILRFPAASKVVNTSSTQA